MAKTVLVTGATGLLGRQILKAFEDAGWTGVGTGFSRAQPPKLRKLDLCNQSEIVALLDDVKSVFAVYDLIRSRR